MNLTQKYLLRFLFSQASEKVEATQPETQTDQKLGDTSTDLTEGNSDKLFTQEEVNKVVSKRVREVKTQFKDYDELKKQNTELQSKLEHLETTNKALSEKYQTQIFDNALQQAASELNLDVELATQLLDKSKVLFTEDKPTNLKELLQVVIEKHPQIVRKQVVTPEVITEQPKQQFSLHNQSKTNFFNGGGLRLNMKQQQE